jgi:hypothetical protein
VLEMLWATRFVGGFAGSAKTFPKGSASVATSRIKVIPVVFIIRKNGFFLYNVQV